MNQEEIRKYQLAQLEIMREIDKICTDLNLQYYIIGGTLLGAIRHSGFIPWDPDIDIAMPRDDYEKLREFFKENNDSKYFYQHYTTEKNHLSPHALIKIKDSYIKKRTRVTKYTPKFEGIYLDILPLDNPPKDKKSQVRQMKSIKKWIRLVELKAGYTYLGETTIKRILKKILKIFMMPISFSYMNKKADMAMKRYSDPSSEYLVSMASHYSYWKQLMPKQWYGESNRINFENLSLCAPSQPDEYLTRIFGNYMELPPIESRYSELDAIERIDYGTSW